MEQAQEEIEAAGISVLLVSDGSTVVRDPVSGAIGTLATAPSARRLRAWPAWSRPASTAIDGLGDVLYAATPIREPLERPRRCPR